MAYLPSQSLAPWSLSHLTLAKTLPIWAAPWHLTPQPREYPRTIVKERVLYTVVRVAALAEYGRDATGHD